MSPMIESQGGASVWRVTRSQPHPPAADGAGSVRRGEDGWDGAVAGPAKLMHHQAQATVFIERVSVSTMLGSLLPHLIRQRLRTGRRGCCWYFEASRLCARLGPVLARLAGSSFAPLQFRLLDVRDEAGVLIRLRMASEDLVEIQAQVMEEFGATRSPDDEQRRFLAYVAKALILGSPGQPQTLIRALLVIRICQWQAARQGAVARPIVFMNRRPWGWAIRDYGRRRGLEIRTMPAPIDLRGWARALVPPALVRLAKRVGKDNGASASVPAALAGGEARLGVEYYGQLNLQRPERYSDLFFWQASSLPAARITVLFGIPHDPLDERKRGELEQTGMRGVAVAMPSRYVDGVGAGRLGGRGRLATAGAGRLERRWLEDQRQEYAAQLGYWTALLERERIKLFTTWFKYDHRHYLLADALDRLGGILTVYQRAYESHPSVDAAIMADVVFGFSPAVAELERRSGSRIGYHVATGYLGDHRFARLRPPAERVRTRLAAAGARRILGYTDENSHDDQRWILGHHLTREAYAFLLERVVAEPWLGLVIKPKAPSTLRRRLGPVSSLLEQAVATGRCLIYEGGETLQSGYPPAAAALAADVMVHGHLTAATAGLEAALAGVPTLLMDREGWGLSPLYRLGVGRVVFTDWPALWQACREHWQAERGSPGFGDWSPMLEELDPFRDGRAAQRMGEYLGWLLEGLAAGRSKDAVLAEAAERYAEAWGADKVTSVGMSRQRLADAVHEPV